ncbi:Dipeptidyl aminopeptidase B [Cyberlindnera fabianii]|uniref:Dipeptidyl aminopeptidase B n=1 Tax=Cyberlindnera fabianii TaxID=36022 RepID=A0A1V2KYZ0_CYBFA|nr:Dipeptidyl aminopeptidase B [Cyberlindnera fabianii]
MTIEEKVGTHKRPNLSKVPIVLGFIVLSLVWGLYYLSLVLINLSLQHISLKSLQLLDPLSKDSLTKWTDNQSHKNLISFEETRNSSFTPEFKSIQWISELDSFTNDKGTFVTQDDDLYLIKSIEDESYERVLYNGSNISYNGIDYSITNFVASPNLQYALIQTNWTQHFRHSSFVIILHMSWTNDVYIYDLQTAESIRASFDGSASIFNGIPDWVYEEEVFEGDSAIWVVSKG